MTELIGIPSLEGLSLLIAETVIGWGMVKVDDFGGYLPGFEFYHPTKGANGNWHYAEDMNAAFELVEHLHRKGDYLSLNYQCGVVEPFDKFYWTALLRLSNSYAYHELPAAAICPAAARSHGIEVELHLS